MAYQVYLSIVVDDDEADNTKEAAEQFRTYVASNSRIAVSVQDDNGDITEEVV